MPTRSQWKKWSLPNKLGAIGTLLGLLAILYALGSDLYGCVAKRAFEKSALELLDEGIEAIRAQDAKANEQAVSARVQIVVRHPTQQVLAVLYSIRLAELISATPGLEYRVSPEVGEGFERIGIEYRDCGGARSVFSKRIDPFIPDPEIGYGFARDDCPLVFLDYPAYGAVVVYREGFASLAYDVAEFIKWCLNSELGDALKSQFTGRTGNEAFPVIPLSIDAWVGWTPIDADIFVKITNYGLEIYSDTQEGAKRLILR